MKRENFKHNAAENGHFARSAERTGNGLYCAETEDIQQIRWFDRKKTKAIARNRADFGKAVCLLPDNRKSCLIRSAEIVHSAVRRIDFCAAARLNRAMTGENLKTQQIWNEI